MLHETYRPHSFDEVSGHSRTVKMLSRLDPSGKAILLTGPSGTGKTTLARIVAATVADPLNMVELDATRLTPAKLEDCLRESHLYAIGEKTGRAYIVNEVHGLRRDVVTQLLDGLEPIPSHATWIFTTTIDGMNQMDGIDAKPFLSRCLVFHLQPDREAFAIRAKEIAEAEGLGDAPLSEYIRLAEYCDDNLRMMLSQIETGVMLGELV
ncbi:MAG TPA: AAA family ATPase [Planctomycetaceae bacterium]|nr:AAA family ATPase [Planctomycetaceae bacterium]